jgi:hypothetical protein
MASEIKVDTIVNAGGDNDSGIDLSTNDNIKFDIAGSQKAMIDSSGNLAVGLSSGISSKLHVASEISLGPDGDNRLIIGSTSGGVGSIGQREAGSSNFSFMNFTGGKVGIGTSSPSGCKLEVSYANADVGMVVSTTDTFSSGNSSLIQFKEVDTVGGSIVFTNGGTATAYVTSSDYRLKENVSYEFDATTRLKQLKPCRFNFKKTPDITVDGFLAHEVTAVPEAITGEKDAMTEEVLYIDGDDVPEGKKVGDVKTPSQIDPQGIDQSKLVPLLTKALQEAVAKIETLEAKVTALESK